MVVEFGETLMLPEVAPPVEKLVPVQEVPLEDQLKVAVPPWVIVVGLTLIVAVVQAGVLQDWLEGPEHGAPPPEGSGLVQVRVCVPVWPHAVTLQALQSLQSPFTTGGGVWY